MRKILHHFRRNRRYSRKERWVVVGGLLALTLAVAVLSLSWRSNDKVQAASVDVQYVVSPDRPIKSDGEDSEEAEITLTQSGSSIPAVNLWVGLKPDNNKLASPRLTYNDWYSPMPERAFFKTNARGQVSFPLMSEKPGEITYDIYLANIIEGEVINYQKLDEKVSAKFVAPE